MRSIIEWASDYAGNKDIIYLVVCGSRAYGTAGEDSDYDVRGVYRPKLGECIAGFEGAGVLEISTDPKEKPHHELVLQPVHKFLKLCWQANPNILDWLFVPDDCRLIMRHSFNEIFTRRGLFLSRQLYAKFRGYATSHLQKMERGLTRDLGEKRKKDIEQFGYSTKNAHHMIRLLRMGCEVLETGDYNVRRPDAEELLEIRSGTWSIERVKAESGMLLVRLDRAVETTGLGPRAPREDIVKLLLRVWSTAHAGQW